MKNVASRQAARATFSTSDTGNFNNCSISESTIPAQESRPDLLVVFRERCEARALLVAEGLLGLQTAVDELQEAAVAQGLVDQHGQDEVQRVMAAAFEKGGER